MNTDEPDEKKRERSDSVEEASFTSRKGDRYWILHNIGSQSYVQLNPAEYSIWKSLKSGINGEFQNSSTDTGNSQHKDQNVRDLITTLTHQGFIHSPESTTPEHTSQKEEDSWIAHYWELMIPVPGINKLIDLLDRDIGSIFRSRWFPWIFLILVTIGLSYFIITEPLPSYPVLLGDDSQLATVLSVYLILITAAILHVFGHALACKRYGRNIGDAGIILYYGMPGLYIDTSDIWMADRRSRIIVSLAGPAVNLLLGSCCALLVLLFPESEPSTFLWRVAFLSFVVALINLNPLLEFDGYYALADLIEIPDLRTRAFAFIRSFSLKNRHHGRDGVFFLIYGISSALFTLGVVIVGVYFWKEHVLDLISELSKARWEADHVLATLAIILVFIPFFAGMIISCVESVRARLKTRGNVPVPGLAHETRDNIHEPAELASEQKSLHDWVLCRRISK